MSKETELRTYSRLASQGHLSWTSLPKSVKNSAAFKELLATHIISKEKRGAGAVLLLRDSKALNHFLDQRFPGRQNAQAGDAFSNQQRYRDSKGAAKTSIGVVLLRGWTAIEVNEQSVNLPQATKAYGCFAAVKPQLKLSKLCLVENLDCFMQAEDILGTDWVFAHTYGRLGRHTLSGLSANKVLHFGDWDYTGLDEYLRLKEQFSQSKLYLPDRLEYWWKRQSKPLKKAAVITKRLRENDDPDVQKVLSLLEQTHRFLEQQAIFPFESTPL